MQLRLTLSWIADCPVSVTLSLEMSDTISNAMWTSPEKTPKNLDQRAPNHRQVCLETVAHEVSVDITLGEIYTLSDVWERYSRLLAEVEIDTRCYKQHRVYFKKQLHGLLHGKIEFVPLLDPHQPQLLSPAVPARIVVRVLKQTTDEPADDDDELRSSHFCRRCGADIGNAPHSPAYKSKHTRFSIIQKLFLS